MENVETLKINGQQRQFPEGNLPENIAELLGRLEIEAATVVAELDGEIIEREQFSHKKLRSGQALELIRFVPGG